MLTRPQAAVVRLTVVAGLSTVAALLPVFLLGGLAALVRRDLGFDEARLGLAVSIYFLSAAAFSAVGGRRAERTGAGPGIRVGLLLSGVAALGIALAADRWWRLAGLMVVGGAGNGLVQPAGNLLLARGVPVTRQGLAFAIKQSAAPFATLTAGLALPLIALTLGWRWTYAGAGVLSLALFPATWGVPDVRPAPGAGPLPRMRPVARRQLLAMAVAAGGGAAAANAMSAFYVESAIAGGAAVAAAGALLSLGSASAIVVRLAVGWRADRVAGSRVPVVAGMLALGGVGLVGIGMAGGPLGVASTLLAFGAGWGWPGLLQLVVVQHHAEAPAAASGVVQSGIFLGGVLGPSIFGGVVGAAGYPAAWTTAALLACGAAVTVVASRFGPG